MGVKCPDCGTDNTQDSEFCKKCGTQIRESEEKPLPTQTIEAPREELTTGSTFARRYQIIEELGKGGMGKVYKAHDTEIKEKIALKLIKPEISADKKTIERFQNELKFARKIGHRNVCRMYDLNKEEGSYYITMEYVSGEDLRSFIRRVGQLPSGKAISIAKQVAEGLAEAHRLGVIHRDLKPSNIMIDKDGNARIMDFGIARSVEAKGITGAGVMIGTPEYMPPEQAEAKEVDQRSDIYSLGVILYKMVTGRVPFEGDTALSIAMKHKGVEPKDPREFNSQIPEDLSRVILRCLEKEKDKRIQSASEVRSELENIERDIPTTERVIPERKPLTSREITVQFSLKKLLIPALVVIAIVIIGLILWQVLPGEKAAPLAPSGTPSLAVMYFENNTGDEELDHWRKAIAELLITDLSQSKYIKILGRDSLYNILTQTNLLETKSYSSEDIKEVAMRGGVNHVLQGGFVKAGDTYRINYTLQDASSGELLGSESMEGKGEESIFSMVDEMTKRIKQNFQLSEAEISSDIDRTIGTITTSSPEAYKFYMEGYRSNNNGDYRTAIQLMEKAVALDPEFSAAYRGLAVSHLNLNLMAESRKYFLKAMELSDRVSDRERYRNEAEFYYWNESTYIKAIEAYKKLLDLYPDDAGGNNALALLYRDIEEWDKALERWEYLRDRNLFDAKHYGNLAYQYQLMGMYDKAKTIHAEYSRKFPDNFRRHFNLASIHLDLGDYDLALDEVEKAFSINPTHYLVSMRKGDIYLYRGDPASAEKEYRKLLLESDSLSYAWGIQRLSELYFVRGRFVEWKDYTVRFIELAQKMGQKEWVAGINSGFGDGLQKIGKSREALERLNKALEFVVETEDWSSERTVLSSKGLVYIKMKSFDKTREVAEKLKELCQKSPNKRIIRMYYHLMGMLELEDGNYPQAIESFKEAVSLDPHVFKSYLDSLGLAYFKSGDLEKAKSEYEKIISCPRGIRSYGIDFVKSFYMLGKIYEQQGDTTKAIEHYEKFLTLWKDADPGIAEVEDAQKRLAGLKGA
jgi:tetratricopeptide (TPR) repeat protein/tRNA A-37 threonylcarbamoyl transferase component Bud32